MGYDLFICLLKSNTEGHSFKTLRFFQVIRLFSPFHIYAYDLENFFYFQHCDRPYWRSNLYNHRIYNKDVLLQQDLEGREHLI